MNAPPGNDERRPGRGSGGHDVGQTVSAIVPPALDPDRVFIGACLHLPAENVVALARLVEPDDLADAQLRVVYGIAADLARTGRRPDPPLVLSEAQDSGAVVGAHRLQTLALLLLALNECVPVPASASHYAAAVLDNALRRRVVQMATRVRQSADESSTVDMLDLVAAENKAVTVVARRRDRARKPIDRPAVLRSVASA